MPFGPKQDDYRSGVIVEQLSLLVRAHGGRNRPREFWFPSLDPKLFGEHRDGGRSFRAWAMAYCPAMAR